MLTRARMQTLCRFYTMPSVLIASVILLRAGGGRRRISVTARTRIAQTHGLVSTTRRVDICGDTALFHIKRAPSHAEKRCL